MEIIELINKYLIEDISKNEMYARKLAKSMGLKYAGWNNYKNSQGYITHKIKDGELIKIEKTEQMPEFKKGQKIIFQKIKKFGNAGDWNLSGDEYRKLLRYYNKSATIVGKKGNYYDIKFDDGFIVFSVSPFNLKK